MMSFRPKGEIRILPLRKIRVRMTRCVNCTGFEAGHRTGLPDMDFLKNLMMFIIEKSGWF